MSAGKRYVLDANLLKTIEAVKRCVYGDEYAGPPGFVPTWDMLPAFLDGAIHDCKRSDEDRAALRVFREKLLASFRANGANWTFTPELRDAWAPADAELNALRGRLNEELRKETAIAYIERLTGKPLTDAARVDLSACNQFDDAGLQIISALDLTELNLTGCDQITDTGLAHKDLTQLQVLVINKDDYQAIGFIEDKDLEHLRFLVSLEELDVKGTSVTARGIEKLQGHLTRLARGD
ncbi:MAG: hypothetical protein L0Y71_23335 [Gemmataceae bacterium]|nr:hypothetical protein [Gemmataceae bacterium]